MLKKLDIHASVLIIKLTVDTETDVTQTKTLALALYLFRSIFKRQELIVLPKLSWHYPKSITTFDFMIGLSFEIMFLGDLVSRFSQPIPFCCLITKFPKMVHRS